MKHRISRLLFVIFLIQALPQSIRAQYYLEDRWPGLKFRLPVGMYVAPDSSKRVYVVEKAGRIKVFHDTGTVAQSDTSTFLNVVSRLPNVSSPGDERGLLGLCFHPLFAQNGYFYVNYTAASPSLRTVVSRFTRDPANPERALPNSEKIIFAENQPYSNHNAGAILFGDDGYLYITMGDGGSGNDPGNTGQRKNTFLGKILRVDVNVPENGPPYAIPPGNPFVGNANGWKEEIVCVGMRNPWKISKDPDQSTIWIGDVGQSTFEEVDTLRIGANYGWKGIEGTFTHLNCQFCDTANYEPPIYVYGRSLGISITGGYVYRGQEMPPLKGAYIYGDYGSRRVWGLKKNQAGVYENQQLLSTAGGDISSFGLGHDKELYVVRYSSTGGQLMKVRCAPARPVLSVPAVTQVCQGDSLVLQAPSGVGVAGYIWSTGDTSRRLVFRQPGNYTISIRSVSSLGCYSDPSAALSLRILPRPALPPLASPQLCTGDTAEVLLPPGLTYTWTGGTVASARRFWQAGSYWVFGTNSIGCRTDTGYFQVTLLPLPPAPVIALNGNALTVSGAAGSQVSWYLDGQPLQTGADTFLLPSQPGTYTACLIGTNGCRSPFSAGFAVAGQDPVLQKARFTAVPNPFTSELLLGLEGEGGGRSAEFEVLDAAGRQVLKEKLDNMSPGQVHRLETGEWKPGAYTIRIKSRDRTERIRVVRR